MTCTILEGDARQVLKTLPDESVHCIVTSPPYWRLRDYGHDDQIGLEQTPDEFVAELVAVFREARRVLRADGSLWLNIGDVYAGDRDPKGRQGPAIRGAGINESARARVAMHETIKSRCRDGIEVPRSDMRIAGLKSKDLVGIPWMTAFALRADGWRLRQEIIWAKGQSGEEQGGSVMPESVRDRCTKAHEQVFLLSKSGRYYFDAKAIAEPALATAADQARARAAGRGHQPAASAYLGSPQRDHSGGYPTGPLANRRSVWRINTEPFPGAHFAVMPTALARDCILAGCPPGGVVLDPFGGAGTTAVAADRLQHDSILIELNPAYAQLARDRLAADVNHVARQLALVA